jgi:XTP/dITP diphosphohydrolase
MDRSAFYYCVLVLVRAPDDPTPLVAEGRWQGAIVLDARGTGGFGYDPYFMPRCADRTASELPAEEKNRASHRAIAARELVRRLREG